MNFRLDVLRILRCKAMNSEEKRSLLCPLIFPSYRYVYLWYNMNT